MSHRGRAFHDKRFVAAIGFQHIVLTTTKTSVLLKGMDVISHCKLHFQQGITELPSQISGVSGCAKGGIVLLHPEDHMDGFAVVTAFIVRHTREKARLDG